MVGSRCIIITMHCALFVDDGLLIFLLMMVFICLQCCDPSFRCVSKRVVALACSTHCTSTSASKTCTGDRRHLERDISPAVPAHEDFGAAAGTDLAGFLRIAINSARKMQTQEMQPAKPGQTI